jgi:hypothetical protein
MVSVTVLAALVGFAWSAKADPVALHAQTADSAVSSASTIAFFCERVCSFTWTRVGNVQVEMSVGNDADEHAFACTWAHCAGHTHARSVLTATLQVHDGPGASTALWRVLQ